MLAKDFGHAGAAGNLFVEFDLMVVIVAEGGVDLGQGEVRVLKVDFLGAPPMGEQVQRHFHHLGVGIVDPSDAAFILMNRSVGQCRYEANLTAGGWLRNGVLGIDF